jgi:hypothetical protein
MERQNVLSRRRPGERVDFSLELEKNAGTVIETKEKQITYFEFSYER